MYFIKIIQDFQSLLAICVYMPVAQHVESDTYK